MTRDEYIVDARSHVKRGEELPWSKMTAQKVIEAREEYARAQFAKAYIDAHYSIAGLARKHGVSKGAMEKVLRGETWTHLLGGRDHTTVRRGARKMA